MKIPLPARGLYIITPDQLATNDLLIRVGAALRGGAAVVQYRNKSDDYHLRREQAKALKTVCDSHQVPLIINDDIELALITHAAGVHLGADDGDWAAIADCASTGLAVGVSCYNDLERAQQARDAKASYVAFGAFYPSTTKPGAHDAHRAELSLLTHARSAGMKACAIGGITAENAATLIAAGADYIAVVNDVMGVNDTDAIERRAKQYAQLFA
jgi:thiamine-phosphate pyrophosphorylase